MSEQRLRDAGDPDLEAVALFLFQVGRKANREIAGGDVPSDYPWCEDWGSLPEHGRRLFLDAALALFGGSIGEER